MTINELHEEMKRRFDEQADFLKEGRAEFRALHEKHGAIDRRVTTVEVRSGFFGGILGTIGGGFVAWALSKFQRGG